MLSKTWQFLMAWPFLMSSHSAKPEHPDPGVRRCDRRELIQRTRVPLCEKGTLIMHEKLLSVIGERNFVVMLRSTDEHKRSFGEIEVEFVPYLKLPLLLDKLRG